MRTLGITAALILTLIAAPALSRGKPKGKVDPLDKCAADFLRTRVQDRTATTKLHQCQSNALGVAYFDARSYGILQRAVREVGYLRNPETRPNSGVDMGGKPFYPSPDAPCIDWQVAVNGYLAGYQRELTELVADTRKRYPGISGTPVFDRLVGLRRTALNTYARFVSGYPCGSRATVVSPPETPRAGCNAGPGGLCVPNVGR